jgi:hypothetical protein
LWRISGFGEYLRGLPLEQERLAKIAAGGLRAACVLMLGCFCLLCHPALAQTDAPSDASPSNKTASTNSATPKTANPKTHVKSAASGPKVNSSSTAKAHPASHPPASKHPNSNTATAAHNSKLRHASSKKTVKKTARGQQKIDPERAQAIQEALIREHYMTGEPAGTWNQASEDALRRYQADHGWQSKTVPDSRALISLGLGPSHDHLLNPDSAMTTGPDISHSASANSSSQIPVSHSAEPEAHPATNPVVPADPVPANSTPANSTPATSADHGPSGPQ